MADNVTTTSTSKQFTINLSDFWKGLLVAVGTPVFTILLQSLNAGSLVFDWKAIVVTALAGLLSYLSKNFFTPSEVKITPPPDATRVTVNIPEPGKTIKSVAVILIFLSLASCVHSQSMFKPLAKPSGKVGVAGVANPNIQNSIRPLAGVTASYFSDGTQLAGGIGVGFQHNVFDVPSQTWTTQYSISGLVFVDTKASAIGGLVLGVANGLIQIGPGFNFGTKQFVILTGFGIKFN